MSIGSIVDASSCHHRKANSHQRISSPTHTTEHNVAIEVYFFKNSYESIATVGEIRVWWRADFQSGSRVLKKVF